MPDFRMDCPARIAEPDPRSLLLPGEGPHAAVAGVPSASVFDVAEPGAHYQRMLWRGKYFGRSGA
jgi:hypothetical protein